MIMTHQNKVFSRVLYFVQNDGLQVLNQLLTPYASRKYKSSSLNGCVLWGTRVVVPTVTCKKIDKQIKVLHE